MSGEGITHGLSGSELLLRSDLRQAALDAYSVVWVPSRRQVRDHQSAINAAIAAVLLRLAKVQQDADCSCGSNTPEGVTCPSCMDGPDEVSQWLRRVGLQIDPGIESRDVG